MSKYIVQTDVLDENDIDQKRILFATRTGASFLINNKTMNQLLEKNFLAIDTVMLQKLIEFEVIIPEFENEFKDIMAINRLGLKDKKTLSSIIQPTANCQLGCGYCGQVHSKENMSNSVVSKTLDRIKGKLETKKFNSLSITWYGGEPLLGYSSIKRMSEDLIDYSQKNNIGYSAFMITNGLSLKPNIFKTLYLDYHVNMFQITLDTLPEHHDNRRITKEGKNTFAIIMKNIKAIVSQPYYRERVDKPILIRMNIDITNYQDVPSFMDYLVSENLQDKVNLSFASIVNWGQETAGDEFGLTKELFAELEIEWFLYAMKLGFQFDYFLPKRDYSSCMVVMEDAEVYDAFGNILPCYEFSYTPFYDEDKYKIGTVFQDETELNQNIPIRKWFDDLEAGKSYCINCNLLPVCNGACPKKWQNNEIGCPEFKLNIEDKLILQYLKDKSNIKELV